MEKCYLALRLKHSQKGVRELSLWEKEIDKIIGNARVCAAQGLYLSFWVDLKCSSHSVAFFQRTLYSLSTQNGHSSLVPYRKIVVSTLLCLLLYGSQTVKLNFSSNLICLNFLYILRSLQIATNLQLSHTLSLCVICLFTDRWWFCRWKQINYMWDVDIQL